MTHYVINSKAVRSKQIVEFGEDLLALLANTIGEVRCRYSLNKEHRLFATLDYAIANPTLLFYTNICRTFKGVYFEGKTTLGQEILRNKSYGDSSAQSVINGRFQFIKQMVILHGITCATKDKTANPVGRHTA